MRRALFVPVLLFALACSDDTETVPPPDAPQGVRVVFDFGADLSTPERFWDAPYPSDLRLDGEGRPDRRGMPIPSAAVTS